MIRKQPCLNFTHRYNNQMRHYGALAKRFQNPDHIEVKDVLHAQSFAHLESDPFDFSYLISL